MYLSAKTDQFFRYPHLYGCMFTYRTTGRQYEALKAGCRWMLDNGAFKGRFVFGEWVINMARMMPYRKNCIGIVPPDAPYKAHETIEKFHKYRAIPEAMGYPIAFPTQDGMTPEMIPWRNFSVLFVGGSDEHKRGIEAQVIGREAIERGKWVHVGRVSSGSAIMKHWAFANSFDGTTFCFDGGNTPVEDKYRLFEPALTDLESLTFQWRLL